MLVKTDIGFVPIDELNIYRDCWYQSNKDTDVNYHYLSGLIRINGIRRYTSPNIPHCTLDVIAVRLKGLPLPLTDISSINFSFVENVHHNYSFLKQYYFPNKLSKELRTTLDLIILTSNIVKPVSMSYELL
jgi:hypothetical protein